ncbi:unnamed protein product [Linum trigynum]|uniref:Uncharacterized protein n=1 Tax=Linum trigynum TaxID=586398 RepID=A0AAV2EPD4_9ROSI
MEVSLWGIISSISSSIHLLGIHLIGSLLLLWYGLRGDRRLRKPIDPLNTVPLPQQQHLPNRRAAKDEGVPLLGAPLQ